MANSSGNNRLMDNLHVDLDISPDLQRLIRNYAEIAPNAVKLGLRAVTKEGSKQVKEQIKSDGLVKSGIYVKSVRGVTNKNKSFIGSKSRIANILEHGAKPHTIKPRRGKDLFLNGTFVSSVHHPGIKAYDPFETVWERMMGSGQVKSLFAQGVQKAIEAVQNGG